MITAFCRWAEGFVIAGLHITMKMDEGSKERLSIDILNAESPGAPIKVIPTLGRGSVDRKVIQRGIFRRPECRA